MKSSALEEHNHQVNGVSVVNWEAIRAEFPILRRTVHGKPLVYLDNGATSQKPLEVIAKMDEFYRSYNANVHRGVHALSQEATAAFDSSRDKVRDFLGAAESAEVILTKGCTEAINLVALSFGGQNVGSGDEILVSTMEHHSNIVPWQILAEKVGATVRPIPITDDGEIDLDAYASLLSERTKIVAIVHISNSLGTINPVKQMIRMAHDYGATVVVDGAQAGPHGQIDVRDLDADFYTLSCHKMFAPTGIGVLYGKRDLLEKMPPYQGGGDMIRSVSFTGTTYADLPYKFEAGTPNISGAIGLGAAIDFMNRIGRREIGAREDELLKYATVKLTELAGIKIYGTSKHKASILSFTVKGIHPHDLGSILDAEGVAVRTGHHCCQPVMQRYKIPATARASFNFANTFEDADTLCAAVKKAQEVFA